MPDLRIAFLGDAVGSPGRRAMTMAAASLRAAGRAHIIIGNGENARQGSGISPDNYRELRRGHAGTPRPSGGIDAVTLGDHCYRDRAIIPILEDPDEPIARPANLAPRAPGKRITRVQPPIDGAPPLYVLTLLGRMFMPVPADNPFDTLDRELAAIPDRNAIVFVEVHGEATSEKQALAWYALDRHARDGAPRVVAVVGTHTHVQTADARLLDHQLAAMTDAGMCGPHRSVIGRSVSHTIEAMSTQAPVPLDVATEDNRARGCLITVDLPSRRAERIESLDIEVRD